MVALVISCAALPVFDAPVPDRTDDAGLIRRAVTACSYSRCASDAQRRC